MSSDGSDQAEEKLMADEIPDNSGVIKYEDELAEEAGIKKGFMLNPTSTEQSSDLGSEMGGMRSGESSSFKWNDGTRDIASPYTF
jgi:hypothetical protein